MNLRLTKKQTAEYIQAILTASSTEERKQAHYQYGQLDEVQKILEVERERQRQQHYQNMQLIQNQYQNSVGNSLANQMLNAANQASSLQSYGYVPVTTQQQPSIWQQAKNWLKGEQQ